MIIFWNASAKSKKLLTNSGFYLNNTSLCSSNQTGSSGRLVHSEDKTETETSTQEKLNNTNTGEPDLQVRTQLSNYTLATTLRSWAEKTGGLRKV